MVTDIAMPVLIKAFKEAWSGADKRATREHLIGIGLRAVLDEIQMSKDEERWDTEAGNEPERPVGWPIVVRHSDGQTTVSYTTDRAMRGATVECEECDPEVRAWADGGIA